MKKKKNIIFKINCYGVVYTIFGALSSCSSDDGGSTTVPGGEGKQVKLTITIDGATSEDYISFVSVGSALSNPSENTIWKVNGVTKTNEMAVSLGKNDFIGSTKTYVIESVTFASGHSGNAVFGSWKHFLHDQLQG